jgi:hypothetical protein
MKGRLWGWAALYMVAQLGNLEWACLPGFCEMDESVCGGGASISMGAVCREPGGTAYLLETLENR